MNDELFSCIAGLILLVIVSIASVVWKSISCGQRWSDYDSSYSILAGCRVNIDGKWTPEDRIREIPIERSK